MPRRSQLRARNSATGDTIAINAEKRTLSLNVTAAELARRKKTLKPFRLKVRRGWLGRYALHVQSADTGAVMDNL